MFEPWAEEAGFARDAVTRAATLCRRIQAKLVTAALEKSDRSPVTVADFAAQAVVARMLMEAFPRDVLVAEEDSATLRADGGAPTLAAVHAHVSTDWPEATPASVCQWIDRGNGQPSGRFWVLDPVDGTKGFLRGDQYVVALALVEDGKVVVGALGCPNLDPPVGPEAPGQGCVAVAARGCGAFLSRPGGEHPVRLQVSNQDDPARARMLRSYEAAHTDGGKIEQVATLLGNAHPPVRMDSQAKFVLLAAGLGELLLRLLSPGRPDYEEKIWDQAAGSIIVEEAGGRVTDLSGRDLDFGQGRTLKSNVGVLSSNGLIHEAALSALRRAGAHQRPGPQAVS